MLGERGKEGGRRRLKPPVEKMRGASGVLGQTRAGFPSTRNCLLSSVLHCEHEQRTIKSQCCVTDTIVEKGCRSRAESLVVVVE